MHAGEILGIFGLGGRGRTELLECIYGLRPAASGTVTLGGKEFKERNPASSIKEGMVLICEDRRGMAMVGSLSLKENIVLSTIDSYSRLGVLDEKRELKDAEEKIAALRIKAQGPSQPVIRLSGGNRQKVVFAKTLMSDPKVFLCDEPTQVVDVKTRAEIHRLLRTKAARAAPWCLCPPT